MRRHEVIAISALLIGKAGSYGALTRRFRYGAIATAANLRVLLPLPERGEVSCAATRVAWCAESWVHAEVAC